MRGHAGTATMERSIPLPGPEPQRIKYDAKWRHYLDSNSVTKEEDESRAVRARTCIA